MDFEQIKEWLRLEHAAEQAVLEGDWLVRLDVVPAHGYLEVIGYRIVDDRDHDQTRSGTVLEHRWWDYQVEHEKLRTPVERLKHPRELTPSVRVRRTCALSEEVEALRTCFGAVQVPMETRSNMAVLDGSRRRLVMHGNLTAVSLEWREGVAGAWCDLETVFERERRRLIEALDREESKGEKP